MPLDHFQLYSTLIADLETDSNDHLEIVMDHISLYLPVSFGLNYSEFPNSCVF